MPCVEDKQTSLDSYEVLLDEVTVSHPHWTDSQIRTVTAQQFRPRYRLNQTASKLENSGIEEYFSTEFSVDEEGHVYFTEYGTSLEQLHQNQLHKTPNKYSVVDHQTSRLIEEAFRNGATEVVTSYHRDGADNRDIVRMIYDPLTRKGRQIITNAASDGDYHTFSGIQNIAETQFSHLQKTKASEHIFVLSNTTISQQDVVKTIEDVRSIQYKEIKEYDDIFFEEVVDTQKRETVVEDNRQGTVERHPLREMEISEEQQPIILEDRVVAIGALIHEAVVVENSISEMPQGITTVIEGVPHKGELITVDYSERMIQLMELVFENASWIKGKFDQTQIALETIQFVNEESHPIFVVAALGSLAEVTEEYPEDGDQLSDGQFTEFIEYIVIEGEDQPLTIEQFKEVLEGNAELIKVQLQDRKRGMERTNDTIRLVREEPHPIFVLAALGNLAEAAEPIVLSEGEYKSMTLVRFQELILANAEYIQDQLEMRIQAMQLVGEAIYLGKEEPAPVFIVAALGALSQVTQPLEFSPEQIRETKSEKEIPDEKQNQLLWVLVLLATVVNKLSENEMDKAILIDHPHETPFPKSTKLTIKSHVEGFSEPPPRNIVAQFSFVLGLWLLLSFSNKEKRQNVEISQEPKKKSDGIVYMDVFCLLLAIIYYLDQIKEQGNNVQFPNTNNTKQTNKRTALPRNAVIYEYLCYY